MKLLDVLSGRRRRQRIAAAQALVAREIAQQQWDAEHRTCPHCDRIVTLWHQHADGSLHCGCAPVKGAV